MIGVDKYMFFTPLGRKIISIIQTKCDLNHVSEKCLKIIC